MKNCKDNSRKIAKITLDIATSIENTVRNTSHRGEAPEATVSVNAALGATRECVLSMCYAACLTPYDSVSSFSARNSCDLAGRGALSRQFEKGLAADAIGGYLASVQGLHELLEALPSLSRGILY